MFTSSLIKCFAMFCDVQNKVYILNFDLYILQVILQIILFYYILNYFKNVTKITFSLPYRVISTWFKFSTIHFYHHKIIKIMTLSQGLSIPIIE